MLNSMEELAFQCELEAWVAFQQAGKEWERKGILGWGSNKNKKKKKQENT